MDERFTDEGLRQLWLFAGGQFHGPNVETGTMPEDKLLPFLRLLASSPSQPEGWLLVPVEPTGKMIAAGKPRVGQRPGAEVVWANMLAAAPALGEGER